MASQWYLYVLRCADDTLYTGITTDLSRRVHEHNHSPRGAKYTASRRPVELAGAWEKASRSEAASAEWHFKKLTRQQKLARVEEVSAAALSAYLSDAR
ncbi:GIY-YIG nuclease family protein [Bradymonas sediminis]|uniref:GIY-YIG nuclease family protein n=1 Tax=Bradymonas sediminis TaxID=1548548 RepID=A0A2Z4FQC7_9DELT|nr:GIY-YIG nuclease family protein [Bradymonas sediminis]AWV91281.1 GIY-YIG nuclease family protein [Bradymonas sediminis]TDP73853.1 putative endonuclease [Bradymonas sediminis]